MININKLFDCQRDLDYIDEIEMECNMKDKSFITLLPIVVTILIAFMGNYMITTNKVSATDARVEIYQQQINTLSKKMDILNDNQSILSSKMATVIETLKYKKDK